MAMPEAPMNKDDFSFSAKNKVGLPWQVTGVQSVSVSEGMHQLAHVQFRSGVLRANAPHNVGPFDARNTVHSYSKSSVPSMPVKGKRIIPLATTSYIIARGQKRSMSVNEWRSYIERDGARDSTMAGLAQPCQACGLPPHSGGRVDPS